MCLSASLVALCLLPARAAMNFNVGGMQFSVQADVILASLQSKTGSREEQPITKRILSCQGVTVLGRLARGRENSQAVKQACRVRLLVGIVQGVNMRPIKGFWFHLLCIIISLLVNYIHRHPQLLFALGSLEPLRSNLALQAEIFDRVCFVSNHPKSGAGSSRLSLRPLNLRKAIFHERAFHQACFKHLVSEHPIICFFLMVSYRDGSKPSKPIHTIICSCCFHFVSCTNIQHLSSILACLGWQAKDSHWCTAPSKPRP